MCDALLQRVRAAHGHARQVHRGAGPLDGPHRRRPAAADPRRRPPDHGLRLHRRRRAGQRAGAAVRRASDEVFNVASGTETIAARTRGGAAEGHGRDALQPEYGPERSVNPVPRRLASTRKAEPLLGFGPRSAWRRGSIASCAGGRRTGLWRSRHERLVAQLCRAGAGAPRSGARPSWRSQVVAASFALLLAACGGADEQTAASRSP